MPARPHMTVCVSMFDDHLAALDAYIADRKRNGVTTTRSQLIRMGLVAIGVPLPPIAERPERQRRRPALTPRPVTFTIGTARNPGGRVVRERKRRRRNPQPAENL